jgi:hypothetical protein
LRRLSLHELQGLTWFEEFVCGPTLLEPSKFYLFS